MKNITRDEMAEFIHAQFGLSKKDCIDIVNDIIEEIITNLINDKTLKIHNFGTFKLKSKKERIGRNPKTKEEVMISPRNVVTFNLSKKVLNLINRKVDEGKEI